MERLRYLYGGRQAGDDFLMETENETQKERGRVSSIVTNDTQERPGVRHGAL